MRSVRLRFATPCLLWKVETNSTIHKTTICLSCLAIQFRVVSNDKVRSLSIKRLYRYLYPQNSDEEITLSETLECI